MQFHSPQQAKLLMVICCLLTQLSQAQTKHDTAAVNQLHRKKFEWMQSLQYDSLNRILDNKVVYIHSNGWVQHKKDVVADFQSGKLHMNQVTVLESSVRLYGKTAIVNGSGNFNVTYEGKQLEMKLMYTEVYVWKHKQWWLVSRHSCKLS